MKKLKTLFLLLCLALPFTLFGCENSNKNSVSMPNSLIANNGVIVFQHVTDADYYTLLINDEPLILDFKHNPYVEIIDNKIHYDANKFFQVGESYTIQVKALAEGKSDSSYTAEYPYLHTGVINKPTNVAINSTVLTWDAVENASYYLVKIVTPDDKQLYDKEGNILTGDDSLSISKANITEYQFNRNRFDFNSLLSSAGNYNFYISAVSNINSAYSTSGYTAKTSYQHKIKLSAPNITSVSKFGDELHMAMVVDPHANAMELSCGKYYREIELNNTVSGVIQSGNLLDINLNQFFQDVKVDDTTLNLNELKQYVFSAKAKNLSANGEELFYTESDMSREYIYENTHKLNTPNVDLTFNSKTGMYIFSWSTDELDIVSGYKVYIMTESGFEEIILDKSNTSMMIEKSFTSIGVQALGVGSNISSDLSLFKDNTLITNAIENLDVTLQNNTISWNNVDGAKYLVECGNNVIATDYTSIDISRYISSESDHAKVIALKNGYKSSTNVISLHKVQSLSVPIINTNQGFVSANKYLLTFTGVNGAIGYHVYVKGATDGDFVKINKLFASTSIDLTNELSIHAQNQALAIKIQAIADPYSIFSDSALSEEVQFARSEKLAKPLLLQPNPVATETNAGVVNRVLYFYGVENAHSYEILVDFSKIVVQADVFNPTKLYNVLITEYMTRVDSYDIRVRALPNPSDTRLLSSDYAEWQYTLNKRLSMVTDFRVEDTNGKYTLFYSNVDENAVAFNVRIVKLNDPHYEAYLESLGLDNEFRIVQSTDITEYMREKGEYHIYMTALAQEGSKYWNSEESSEPYRVNKLNTLNTPIDIQFTNSSNSNYIMSWTGDDHADYYTVTITQPNMISAELKAYNNSIDINEYIRLQGSYTISISAKVNASGDNAKDYENGPAGSITHLYTRSEKHDYNRNTNTIYGTTFDYFIDDVSELKNALWYHYLYGVDNGLNNGTTLSLYIDTKTKPDSNEIESIKEALMRLASEANDEDIKLHNFAQDEVWLGLLQESTTQEYVLMEYMSRTLLNLYPEMHSLKMLDVDHESGSNIFNISYKNGLNGEKYALEEDDLIKFAKDYGNKFAYLDSTARRSDNTIFKIDNNSKYIEVTTTEQLVHAVQSGARPLFIGNYNTAEQIYNNAKKVLLAIVNDKMTDIEKVTRIFDWLEYGFAINTKGDMIYDNNGYLVDADIDQYGIRAEYYLEGIFNNITVSSRGGGDGEFYLGNRIATSESYSKAFALLCAIEGIECVLVNGEYVYDSGAQTYTKAHTWNKVRLSTTSDFSNKTWYNVDLTFSDNRIYMNGDKYNEGSMYGISSHDYFLVTDNYMKNEGNTQVKSQNLRFVDKNFIKSKVYSDTRGCNTYYDYYSNNSFKMTKDQLINLPNIGAALSEISNILGFEYSKAYEQSTVYRGYYDEQNNNGLLGTATFGNRDKFLFNTLLYAKQMALNSDGKATVEFKISGESIFTSSDISYIFDVADDYYLGLNLHPDSNANGNIYTSYNVEQNCLIVVYCVS
ncbi:MAG: hypothetical protein ACLRFL_01510 [Clostridia bacterium]